MQHVLIMFWGNFANMFDAFTPFLDGKIARHEKNTCRHKRMVHPEDCVRLGLVGQGLTDL